MMDQKRWASAWARFEAFRNHIPSSIDQSVVDEYHSILNDLRTSSGEFLNEFVIPPGEMKPKATAFQFGTRRRPGRTFYSKENYCDDEFFERRVDGLWRYLSSTQKEFIQPRPTPAKTHPPGHSSEPRFHVENNYGSIQHGSPGSSATISYQNNDPRLLALVNSILSSMEKIALGDAERETLKSDAMTIRAQASSPSPKHSIVTESLKSARTIIEGAVKGALTSGLVTEITKLLGS